MKRIKFIFAAMRKGLSWKDALVATVFGSCCSQDYRWLARRSKKTLTDLVEGLKARCGKDVYKMAIDPDPCPKVLAAALQVWLSCGFFYWERPTSKGNNPSEMGFAMGNSGCSRTRYTIRPQISSDEPCGQV